MQSSRLKLNMYSYIFCIKYTTQSSTSTQNHDRVLNKIGNENICTCAIEFFIVKSNYYKLKLLYINTSRDTVNIRKNVS